MKVDGKASQFDTTLLGRHVIVFLKDTLQTVLYQNKEIRLSMFVDGLIVRITEKNLFLSDGTSDKIERVIPRSSIAYIELDDDQVGSSGLIKVMDYSGPKGDRH